MFDLNTRHAHIHKEHTLELVREFLPAAIAHIEDHRSQRMRSEIY